MAKKKESFENSLGELEKIVRQLEDGDLSLEESLELFETGVKLSRECRMRLTQAERRIEVLSEDADGNPVLEEITAGNLETEKSPQVRKRIVFDDDEDDDYSTF